MGAGRGSVTVSFAAGVDATTPEGDAATFGPESTARSGGGSAFAHGESGLADSSFVSIATGSAGTAIGGMLAVALGAYGFDILGKRLPSVASSTELAFAWNIFAEARGGRVAVAAGKYGVADAPLAIALGEEGQAVARTGGTIAIAFYDRHEGHWEFPHGCDQTWVDGDLFLAGLRVAKVGEDNVRPDHVYRLDHKGDFVEVRPADPLDLSPKREPNGSG
jgi:hypothetical protein